MYLVCKIFGAPSSRDCFTHVCVMGISRLVTWSFFSSGALHAGGGMKRERRAPLDNQFFSEEVAHMNWKCGKEWRSSYISHQIVLVLCWTFLLHVMSFWIHRTESNPKILNAIEHKTQWHVPELYSTVHFKMKGMCYSTWRGCVVVITSLHFE